MQAYNKNILLSVSVSIYLLGVSERGVAVVSDELHGLSRSAVEEWRLPIHHLYHHDTQRPDVHLVRERGGGMYVCITMIY